MEPWYKVATPRKEVREGRSFNPDELAIALEQVVAKTAPEDYRDPAQFFSRTCFTRALREHAGMVLRRLSGRTDNTPPVGPRYPTGSRFARSTMPPTMPTSWAWRPITWSTSGATCSRSTTDRCSGTDCKRWMDTA